MSTIEPNNSTENQRVAIVGTLANTMLGFRGELIRDLVASGHTVFAFAIDYTPATEQEIRAMQQLETEKVKKFPENEGKNQEELLAVL